MKMGVGGEFHIRHLDKDGNLKAIYENKNAVTDHGLLAHMVLDDRWFRLITAQGTTPQQTWDLGVPLENRDTMPTPVMTASNNGVYKPVQGTNGFRFICNYNGILKASDYKLTMNKELTSIFTRIHETINPVGNGVRLEYSRSTAVKVANFTNFLAVIDPTDVFEYTYTHIVDISSLRVSLRNVIFGDLGLVDAEIFPLVNNHNTVTLGDLCISSFNRAADPRNTIYKDVPLERGDKLTAKENELLGSNEVIFYNSDKNTAGVRVSNPLLNTRTPIIFPEATAVWGEHTLQDGVVSRTLRIHIPPDIEIPEDKKFNSCIVKPFRKGIGFAIWWSKPVTKRAIHEKQFTLNLTVTLGKIT